jgi:hypothetical protein
LPIPSFDLTQLPQSQPNFASSPRNLEKLRSQSLPVLPVKVVTDDKRPKTENHRKQHSPPKKFKNQAPREEAHQTSSSNKKKVAYVPKQKAASLENFKSPQEQQLEQLSNQLKMMLNVKSN